MPISAREAALNALITYRRRGIRTDILLNDIIERERLDKREASLFYRLTMGVIQNQNLCDYYIRFFLTSPIKKLQPVVLDILRLSVYQLVFLTKIPRSAAVNEGVKLAKKHSNKAASGLVNAVLRRVAESLQNLPPIEGKDVIEVLSIKYSHPPELVEYLVSRLGQDGAEAFLEASNKISPLVIRINELKTTPEDLARELRLCGIEGEPHPMLKGFFKLYEAGNPEKMPLFRQGYFTVQDPASAMAVMACGIEKDMNVLDCCAAPGGKSFMAAQLMQNTGSILSCDLHEKKLRHIIQGAERLGIENIECKAMNASEPHKGLYEKFDVIICDVPCSGFGVIAKKPEIRFKTFQSISALPKTQLSILKNVSKYLKKGGTLLYSTCTVMENENEDIIYSFIEADDSFILEPFSLPAGEAPHGHITLWPHVHNTDGFFIAKLKKAK